MTSNRTILITGVTGNQGGAVAQLTKPLKELRLERKGGFRLKSDVE